MRTVTALLGMTAAFALAVAAVGAFGWGAYLMALTTSDGDTPGAAAGALLALLSFVGGSGAHRLWVLAQGRRWPENDPASAFFVVFMVLWFGGLALVALWILLRVTGVIGPLIWAHGL